MMPSLRTLFLAYYDVCTCTSWPHRERDSGCKFDCSLYGYPRGRLSVHCAKCFFACPSALFLFRSLGFPSSSQNGARTGLLLYVVRTSSGQCRGRPFGAGHLSGEMISKVAFSYGEIWMEDDTHTNDVYTHIRHKSREKTFYGHQHRHGLLAWESATSMAAASATGQWTLSRACVYL